MSLIIPANTLASGGFSVDNSCRFEESSSAYMHKTPSSAGNRQKWTFSAWLKLTADINHYLFSSGTGATDRTYINFNDGALAVQNRIDSSNVLNLTTNAVHRDVAAWYHFVVAIDTTQGTAANRAKCYVNGTQITSFATETYPDQNVNTFVNNTQLHTVGKPSWTDSAYYSGYMAEAVFIDGLQLAPTSFGEFDSDSGIWKPIDVSGLTFGTNGFYLDFEDSANLGNDANGGTDLTEANLTAIDQTTDTPTNNFATLNPLHFNATIPSAGTLSDGNLTFTSSQGGSAYPAMYSTMAVSQGKWYAEFKVTTGNSAIIGIGAGSLRGGFFGGGYYDYAYYYDGTFYNNGGNTGSQSSYTDGDIISVAMDLDNNKVYVAKNNTWQHSGNPSGNSGGYTITAPASQTDATGTGVYHIAYGDAGGGTPAIQGNFGNPPFTGTDQSDGNSRGSFEYAPPSGYLSLCTANLSEYG